LLRLRVSPEVIGVFLLIASLIPLAGALNVYAHVWTSNMAALSIHGGTALFLGTWLLPVTSLIHGELIVNEARATQTQSEFGMVACVNVRILVLRA
jgi:hypothetical protein